MQKQISIHTGNFSIRAGNPDNERETRQLMRLYGAEYGVDRAVRLPLQQSFWRAHMGRSFMGLCAWYGDELAGFVGLRAGRHNENHAQFILPMLNASFEDRVNDVAAAMWPYIERCAVRQGWSMLYAPVAPVASASERILVDVFGMCVTAVLPGNSDWLSAGESSGDPHVLAVRCFDASAQQRGTAASDIPAEHREILQLLCAGVYGTAPAYTPANAGSTSNLVVNGYREKTPVFADYEVCLLAGAQRRQFIVPSAVSHFENFLLATRQAPIDALFISAADYGCAAFCHAAEAFGYQFSGVVPAANGIHSVVYSRFAGSIAFSSAYYDKNLQTLISYIRSEQSTAVIGLVSENGLVPGDGLVPEELRSREPMLAGKQPVLQT